MTGPAADQPHSVALDGPLTIKKRPLPTPAATGKSSQSSGGCTGGCSDGKCGKSNNR